MSDDGGNDMPPWLVQLLIVLIVIIGVIICINILADNGAFDFIAWRAWLWTAALR